MRPSQAPTLARRLLVPLAWMWLVGLGVAVTGAAYVARDAAQQAFDRSLRDEASAIAARVIWSDRGPLLDVSRQIMELLA
ncbi:MAG: sensor histidine kinase N-terminal domain-containing protein, partial [Betaproteobacteria bacterium]